MLKVEPTGQPARIRSPEVAATVTKPSPAPHKHTPGCCPSNHRRKVIGFWHNSFIARRLRGFRLVSERTGTCPGCEWWPVPISRTRWCSSPTGRC